MAINENEKIKNNIKCHANCEKLLNIRNEMCINKNAGLLTTEMELKYRVAEVEELDKQLEILSVLEADIKKLKAENIVLNERNKFTDAVGQETSTDPAYLQNVVNNLKRKEAYFVKLEESYGEAKVLLNIMSKYFQVVIKMFFFVD